MPQGSHPDRCWGSARSARATRRSEWRPTADRSECRGPPRRRARTPRAGRRSLRTGEARPRPAAPAAAAASADRDPDVRSTSVTSNPLAAMKRRDVFRLGTHGRHVPRIERSEVRLHFVPQRGAKTLSPARRVHHHAGGSSVRLGRLRIQARVRPAYERAGILDRPPAVSRALGRRRHPGPHPRRRDPHVRVRRRDQLGDSGCVVDRDLPDRHLLALPERIDDARSPRANTQPRSEATSAPRPARSARGGAP